MFIIMMVNLPYGILKSDDPNSYNYIFGQVKKDQFFIDLRKANGVTKTWLNEQHQIFAGITKEGLLYQKLLIYH